MTKVSRNWPLQLFLYSFFEGIGEVVPSWCFHKLQFDLGTLVNTGYLPLWPPVSQSKDGPSFTQVQPPYEASDEIWTRTWTFGGLIAENLIVGSYREPEMRLSESLYLLNLVLHLCNHELNLIQPKFVIRLVVFVLSRKALNFLQSVSVRFLAYSEQPPSHRACAFIGVVS